MKRTVAGLLFLLTLSLLAGLAQAATPQLVLDHTLTGYHKDATTVTLDYSLHVVNPGDFALAEISLSLVPLPPLTTRSTTVSIGYLGPHRSCYVALQIVIPVLLDANSFSRTPIFWAGEYQDVQGKRVQFPAKSVPGGAK